MKQCLITGGAGFIGSHLSEYLLEQGCRVKVIDDLSTGSMKNILSVKNHPNFSYITDDCQNRNLMAELVDEADEIYHLAAAVGVRLIVQDTAKTIHLNYSLTQIVLEMAEKKQKPVLSTISLSMPYLNMISLIISHMILLGISIFSKQAVTISGLAQMMVVHFG